jgi:hypothetical protein
VALNGNHELMNAAGDLRYVTADGLRDYGGAAARAKAFAPGSPLARRLATRGLTAIVGDAIFAHAGVTPRHVEQLEALEREARAWLRGESAAPPRALVDDHGPVWTRLYGEDETPAACAAARAVLARLRLRRMVVAHTTQRTGINAICDGQVWRIDVGLSRRYGGPMQVLELTPGRVKVLVER